MSSFKDWFMGYDLEDDVHPPCNRPGSAAASAAPGTKDEVAVPAGPAPDGVVAFVLSLIAVFFLAPLAFVSLYLASKDRKVCEQMGVRSPGLLTAAWVISIFWCIVFGLAVLVAIIALITIVFIG